MNIQIKATNMELTAEIKAYIEKKMESVSKFVRHEGKEAILYIEVGKTTNHHKNGYVFKSEARLDTLGSNFTAIAEEEDLYTAIDASKEDLVRELISSKDKKQTLYKRGAKCVKKMLKGLSKRNPFTSKY